MHSEAITLFQIFIPSKKIWKRIQERKNEIESKEKKKEEKEENEDCCLILKETIKHVVNPFHDKDVIHIPL